MCREPPAWCCCTGSVVFTQEDPCPHNAVAARLGYVVRANIHRHCWASTLPCSPTKGESLWLSVVPGVPQRGRGAVLLPVREKPASARHCKVEQEPPHAHPYVSGTNSAETDW